MRILGVDPGLTRCGIGIIEARTVSKPTLVTAGVIRTPSDMAQPNRLLKVFEELQELVEEFNPGVIAIEQVFAGHNLPSMMGTSQVVGLAMLLGAMKHIPVSTHTPTEVKAAVTGSGSADKTQIGSMISKIFNLNSPPKPADAADAVALALCQLWRGQANNKISQAVTVHSYLESAKPKNRYAQAEANHKRAAKKSSNATKPVQTIGAKAQILSPLANRKNIQLSMRGVNDRFA